MEFHEENTFLGFDWSTQKLKAIIVSDNLKVLQEAEVHYDSDLPEFRTSGGVIRREKGEVVSPSLMWVKALDMVLDRLMIAGADFSRVAAVSGAAQQHGSVWWARGSEKLLATLNGDHFLYEQLPMAFSLLESPVWMDTSTAPYCRRIEEAAGGPLKLARVTGSRAYERFTGSQIAKVFAMRRRVYDNTDRISLISSFACSLFAGQIAPLDWADASGMNLMDVHTKSWHEPCLKVCGDDTLTSKLGQPVSSSSCVGSVSSYFVDRFGFSDSCKVIAFTGDNPSTVAGLRLSPGWIIMSLGTSDTLLLWLSSPPASPALDGHLLCSAVQADAFSALLCFSNGSLVREAARDRLAEGSWEKFNALLNSAPRGNHGNMGLFFDCPEIIPSGAGPGCWLYEKSGITVNKMAADAEVRALIEGQFIARRAHAQDMGFVIDKDTKILATGGASTNKNILQVLSDVFNAPVYVQDCANSAVLGAAYRARHGLLNSSSPSEDSSSASEPVDFFGATAAAPEPSKVCSPYADAAQIYEPMIERYREYIKNIVNDHKKTKD